MISLSPLCLTFTDLLIFSEIRYDTVILNSSLPEGKLGCYGATDRKVEIKLGKWMYKKGDEMIQAE